MKKAKLNSYFVNLLLVSNLIRKIILKTENNNIYKYKKQIFF